MQVCLSDIKPNETLETRIDGSSLPEEMRDSGVRVEALAFVARIRKHESGYRLAYEYQGEVRVGCCRCADPMRLPLRGSDLVFLQFQHPQSGHVVLNPADMNVKFIQGDSFDVARFAQEVIELDIPQFPRHEDSSCTVPGEIQPMDAVAELVSPFASLRSWVDPERACVESNKSRQGQE